MTLIEITKEVVEMSCCGENDTSKECCCEHPDKEEKTPCRDGKCSSNGCFFSVQHNLISDIESDFGFFNFDFLDKEISSDLNSFIPIVDQFIWTPPKIYS